MNFPKLKHALLCRVLVYIVVLGGFIAPIIIVANIRFIPDAIKLLVGICFAAGLLVYIIKNIAFLMTMDIMLAMLHCWNTARKRFVLPPSFSVARVERKITRFGKKYEPSGVSPRPDMLQYKCNTPITIYSSGIEKVVCVYHTDVLDKNCFQAILRSGNANSLMLKGKQKPPFLDSKQRKASLNRVAVILIIAKNVEDSLRNELADLVCINNGDGFDAAILPCVIDLENGNCTFDSLRIPYYGYQYPVKNRGIRIIRKYLFHNRFPFAESPDMLEPLKQPITSQSNWQEESLWNFWHMTKKEIILDRKRDKKRFEKMTHGELIYEQGCIYLKWNDRGILTAVELDDELRIAHINPFDVWHYPKANKISQETIKALKQAINTYFAQMGYSTRYHTFEE